MIRSLWSSAVVFGVIVFTACNRDGKTGDAQPSASALDTSDAAMMGTGLNLLNSGDASGAEATFREVLKRNPTHYGAHFQLATALDRGGKPAEARPMWQQVLQLAQSSSDTATIRIAQARLAAPDTASQAAMMSVGLNLLYSQKNPTAAIDQFRKVLERSPAHYGATYQLAVALDSAGKPAEARPLWQKVLKMAQDTKDQATINTAATRLTRNP